MPRAYAADWLARAGASGYEPISRIGFLLNCFSIVEVLDYTQAAGQTFTVNGSGEPAAYVFTEGADFTAAGTNTSTATSLKQAILQTIPGVRVLQNGATLTIIVPRRNAALTVTFSDNGTPWTAFKPGSQITQQTYWISTRTSVPSADSTLKSVVDSGRTLDPIERTVSDSFIEIITENDPWLRTIISQFGVRNMAVFWEVAFEPPAATNVEPRWERLGSYWCKSGVSLGRSEGGDLKFTAIDVFGFLKEVDLVPPTFVGAHPVQVMVRILHEIGFTQGVSPNVNWATFDELADPATAHHNLSNIPADEDPMRESQPALDLLNSLCMLTGGSLGVDGLGRIEYILPPETRSVVTSIDASGPGDETVFFAPSDPEDRTINAVRWEYNTTKAPAAGVRDVPDDNREPFFFTRNRDFHDEDFEFTAESPWLRQHAYGSQRGGSLDNYRFNRLEPYNPALLPATQQLFDLVGAPMLGFAGLRTVSLASPGTLAPVNPEPGAGLDITAVPPRRAILKLAGPGHDKKGPQIAIRPDPNLYPGDEYIAISSWSDRTFSGINSFAQNSSNYKQIDDYTGSPSARIVPNRVQATIDTTYSSDGYTNGREGRGTTSPPIWLLDPYFDTDGLETVVTDVTIPAYRADQIIARAIRGLPEVEVYLTLDNLGLALGDKVTCIDPDFVSEGIDGLSAAQEFEVISEKIQLHGDRPRVEYVLAYAGGGIDLPQLTLPQSPNVDPIPPNLGGGGGTPGGDQQGSCVSGALPATGVNTLHSVDYTGRGGYTAIINATATVTFDNDGPFAVNQYNHIYTFYIATDGLSAGSKQKQIVAELEARVALDLDLNDDTGGATRINAELDDDSRPGTYQICLDTTWLPPAPSTFQARGIQFEGGTEEANAGNLTFLNGAQSMTFGVLMRIDDWSTGLGFFGRRSASFPQFDVRRTSPGEIAVAIQGSGGTYTHTIAPAVNEGDVFSLIGVLTGGGSPTFRLYVDGAEETPSATSGSVPATVNTVANADWIFGATATGVHTIWTMGECAVWSALDATAAATPSQVAEIDAALQGGFGVDDTTFGASARHWSPANSTFPTLSEERAGDDATMVNMAANDLIDFP